MKSNVIFATRDYLHKNLGSIVTFAFSTLVVLCASLAFTQFASAQTAPITAQASFGARGANVTNIQAYLATRPEFYPEGLVTGYYGNLTVAAVRRFQAFYGIVSSGTAATTGYGRVGPSTMAKLNELILGGSVSGDRSAPYISNVTVVPSGTQATVSWNTNEVAMGRLYYSTNPISFNEGNEFSQGFAVTSGTVAAMDNTLRVNHGTTISGLSSNTTYYYLIVVTDASGNVSMSLPGATFRTGF